MRTALLFIVCLLPLGVLAGSVEMPTLATNRVQAATTNTVTAAISAEADTDIPVYISFNLTNAATGNQYLAFQSSAEGTYWQTLSSVVIAANGTNTVQTITNLATGSMPYVRLNTWGNAATNAATNLVIKYYKSN